ncbi:hypothetical protein MK805_11550 [Shimazuella sp. AN120528]|uniref:hypothetical protein n=1 Tax=Shimazuella soli TaxID=1892854 RepID=UPI001F114834|nr:hypothetical protein [Shimazuella soli]MCH5585579.1 hypothetical protein [Shimazuella soli]
MSSHEKPSEQPSIEDFKNSYFEQLLQFLEMRSGSEKVVTAFALGAKKGLMISFQIDRVR